MFNAGLKWKIYAIQRTPIDVCVCVHCHSEYDSFCRVLCNAENTSFVKSNCVM